jgi:glycosyltransferase involved in cell wall biosynthesis
MQNEELKDQPHTKHTSLMRRRLLFRRDFRGLTGGHLKVWHYFQHATTSRIFEPQIYLTPQSFEVPENPWLGIEPPPEEVWRPEAADLLFVGGMDWQAVPDPSPRPVINLIQGISHANPDDPRRRYLSRPAVRICVSEEVTAAILGTGEVNGPVHTIPNGTDLERIQHARERNIDVLIAGVKNPICAKALHDRLVQEGTTSRLLTSKIPRADFLDLLSRSAVVVALPLEQEGFFLPALEGMSAGAVVVCPDCVGNRSFCHDRINCFRPPYELEALVRATLDATRLEPGQRAALLLAATSEVAQHGLETERAAFLQILDSL